ncbi:MAG TPA: thioesterase family protein [Kofleriaceae bacterium]|nr:thioesterase family protein [Kofleriaceae bacterium]
MVHQVRVIFGDTDKMGVVYYANYLRYFESARAALLRSRGLSGRDLDSLGVGFPVAEAHVRYRRPALYEDLLDVHIAIAELGFARVRFEYVVRRGEEVLADGFTLHACTDTSGRPCRIPERLRAALEGSVEGSAPVD